MSFYVLDIILDFFKYWGAGDRIMLKGETILKSVFKGALDKLKIYLFVSYSIEDFKLNQYQNFQLTLPMRFHFMRYFVNSIIFRVSHRLLYCVFIEVDFEK